MSCISVSVTTSRFDALLIEQAGRLIRLSYSFIHYRVNSQLYTIYILS